jgi:hypothetical protein
MVARCGLKLKICQFEVELRGDPDNFGESSIPKSIKIRRLWIPAVIFLEFLYG